MEFNCPSCGSESTQKLSLAVAGGTFSNQSVSMGAGLTGTGVGVGGVTTKGTSTSKFAEKNAEPEKLPPIRTFIAVLIFSGFVALFVGGAALQVGFWLGLLAVAFCIYNNVKLFPREHAEWDSKFLCQRCSTIFVPKAKVEEGVITDASNSGSPD